MDTQYYIEEGIRQLSNTNFMKKCQQTYQVKLYTEQISVYIMCGRESNF